MLTESNSLVITVEDFTRFLMPFSTMSDFVNHNYDTKTEISLPGANHHE
jgi:hypothetical protein